MKPSQALARLALLPAARRPGPGPITGGLQRLADFAPFRDVINQAATAGPVDVFLTDLTATFARVYLSNATSVFHAVVFVHSVTGPAALRMLLPYLDDAVARAAARYAWQASAGLYTAYAAHPPMSETAAPAPLIDELVDRAVANGDEHAIKFTEACLREFTPTREPALLHAAAHGIALLPKLSAW